MVTTVARAGLLGVVFALGAGCVQGDDTSDEAPPSYQLELTETEYGVHGSYTEGAAELRFKGEQLSEHTVDIQLVFNGLTITALVDSDNTVIEYDGYASDNGEDTQITDKDRATLLSFSKAMDSLGADLEPELELVRRFANVWAEFPTTKELHGVAVGEADRSYSSLCWAQDTYQQVTHDDWNYDRWDDASTYSALIGMQPAGSCSDGTYFWNGSSWSCYEPDHSTSVEYAYGSCFGRCGGGCGSSSQLTWDCADHDSCVRFGHSLASFWCNDEFSSTIDDFALAPNCN